MVDTVKCLVEEPVIHCMILYVFRLLVLHLLINFLPTDLTVHGHLTYVAEALTIKAKDQQL